MIDIFHYFTGEEKINGLEISESKIRFVVLAVGSKKEGKKMSVKFWQEVKLPRGTIREGELKDQKSLVKALNELEKKNRLANNSVVVLSLPVQKNYLKVFSFPEKLTNQEVEESMGLIINSFLPRPLSEVYYDWEKIQPLVEGKKEVLFSSEEKREIDPYLKALELAGFTCVACETHVLSLARLVSSEKPTCLTLINSAGISSMVMEKGSLRFCRFSSWLEQNLGEDALSRPEASKKALISETRRTINFYQTEQGEGKKIESVILAGENSPIKGAIKQIGEELGVVVKEIEIPISLNKAESLKKDSSGYVALSAALRGFIKRREDTFISLMDIGTEQAYEEKKALSYNNFVNNFLVVTCSFFAIAFLGIYLFLYSLKVDMNKELELQNRIPSPQDFIGLNSKADAFNKDLFLVSSIKGSSYLWSGVIEEIKDKTSSGITLFNLKINSSSNSLVIEGRAKTRESLEGFKNSFSPSEFFSEVDMPIKYLEKESNIDFTISFKINTSALLPF